MALITFLSRASFPKNGARATGRGGCHVFDPTDVADECDSTVARSTGLGRYLVAIPRWHRDKTSYCTDRPANGRAKSCTVSTSCGGSNCLPRLRQVDRSTSAFCTPIPCCHQCGHPRIVGPSARQVAFAKANVRPRRVRKYRFPSPYSGQRQDARAETVSVRAEGRAVPRTPSPTWSPTS